MDVEGENGGFAAVERATNGLRSAIDGADVIIVVTGGNAQAAVAVACSRQRAPQAGAMEEEPL